MADYEDYALEPRFASLPANEDAERTLLGAILLDERAFDVINEGISDDDWYLDSHKRLWMCMKRMKLQGKTIDIVTLVNELNRSKEVSTVGGVAYIASLTEGLPRRLDPEAYIKIVVDKALLRRVIVAADKLIKRAVDASEQTTDIISEHTKELVNIAASSKIEWKTKPSREFFVPAIEFATVSGKQVDWSVNHIMQRGANGLILADPGAGKSLLVSHLSLHLASGTSWMQEMVFRRVRVGLVSREDYPTETGRRIANLIAGEQLDNYDLEDWFWLSTRAQIPTWSLDNDRDVDEIIYSIREKRIEIVFFDVFRTMWSGNENRTEETQVVLGRLNHIRDATNAACVLIHHLSKAEAPTVFHRSRGNSAIEGWREFAFGITVVNPEEDEDQWVRKIQFYTKAGRSHKPVYFQIGGANSVTRIEQCEAPESAKRLRASDIVKKKKGLEQQAIGWQDPG